MLLGNRGKPSGQERSTNSCRVLAKMNQVLWSGVLNALARSQTENHKPTITGQESLAKNHWPRITGQESPAKIHEVVIAAPRCGAQPEVRTSPEEPTRSTGSSREFHANLWLRLSKAAELGAARAVGHPEKSPQAPRPLNRCKLPRQSCTLGRHRILPRTGCRNLKEGSRPPRNRK